ncbi:MAG: hypothetical protein ACLQI7_12745 [Streptosporangiaceae bacterium]
MYVRRSHTASAQPSYAWLLDVLLGGMPAVTWAAAGELPDGFELAEQFAVLPAGAGQSFLVSLKARSGASSALTSYNALRSPRRRLARRVLGVGLRTGFAQPLLPSKIDVGTAVGATSGQLSNAVLSEYLCELFGRGPVVVAVRGGGGPYRKPVLQVFGMDGTPLGFVKVGWNDWTRDAVRREAAALRACAGSTMRLGVPALIGQYVWRGLDLLVTAPLPPGVRRLNASSRLPEVGVIREISRLSEVYFGELAASPWWLGLRTRIATGVIDPAARAQLDEVADGVERQHGRAPLEFGRWHGDFVPWNLARLGTRLFAWDWESSAPQAPVGFDALHFHFQVAFVACGRSVEEAAALAVRSGRPALDALGIAADMHSLVATLHLLDLAVRHEEARSSAGDIDARFFPAVLDVLERGLASPPGTVRLHPAGRSS